MEVILLENIANLGKLGDTVIVKAGYGRNFLVPQAKAVTATAENLKVFESRKAELLKEAGDQLSRAEQRKLEIEAVTLKYTDEEKKLVKGMIYTDEIDWLIKCEKRNKFICDLALTRESNTLILFQYVEKHGKKLFKYLKDKSPERPVFFVSGEIKTEIREEIRAITEKSKNAIIVASYGTFSTGINIRNLHNIIFGHPVKSRIRNLQSVGRVLRKYDDKEKATLFDISDDLSWKKHKNYSLRHFFERVKIYNSEKFDYKLRSIKL